MKLSTNWFSHGSKISGCASILGSWQICHNVCTSLIAMLATLGIAVQGMPLLFLNRWQMPIWIAAVVLFGVVLTIRVGMKMRCITTRGVFGNAGLLMAGAPFAGEAIGPIRLIGFIIVLAVLFWWLKDLVVRRQESGWVIDFVEQGRKVVGGMVGVVAVILLIFSAKGSQPPLNLPLVKGEKEGVTQSRMKFTLFDIAHAKELMDKNGDGQCDACGMAIGECIESGMMQCTMDPNAKIGLLGSQHTHASLNVYQDDQAVNLALYAHTMDAQDGGTGSSFIHVEGPDFEKLHMHATGVPLKLFFESVGLGADGAKVMVNGTAAEQWPEYAFQEGDQIIVKLKSGTKIL